MKSALRSYANKAQIKKHIERINAVGDLYGISEKVIIRITTSLQGAEPEYLSNILKKPYYTDKELQKIDACLTY